MKAVKLVAWLGLILGWMSAVEPPANAWDGCRVSDVDGNGAVELADIEQLQSMLGLASPREDLDGDGIVGIPDVLIASRFELLYLPGAEQSLKFHCPACAADFNQDGNADADDLAELTHAYGRNCRPDLNRDGIICPFDRQLFEEYFGASEATRLDFNDDGVVDEQDHTLLLEILGDAARTDCRPDLNRDGRVDRNDLWFFHIQQDGCPSDPVDPGGRSLEMACDEGPKILEQPSALRGHDNGQPERFGPRLHKER